MQLRTSVFTLAMVCWAAVCVAQPSPQNIDPRTTRGLSAMDTRFVERGQWIGGLAASWSAHRNKGYNFLIVDGIDSQGHTLYLSPMAAYAFKANTALGGRFTYSRTALTVDAGSLTLGGEDSSVDIDMDVNYYHLVQHNYLLGAIWRQYIPLGRNKRLALFNEVQLAAGGGQAIFAMDSPIRGTYQNSFTASLGVMPGFVAFATEHLAFEVQVGMLGINYTRVRQVHDRARITHRESSNMNFKINPLSVGLGVSFYL